MGGPGSGRKKGSGGIIKANKKKMPTAKLAEKILSNPSKYSLGTVDKASRYLQQKKKR
ncbi:MAG: hypothetical protein ABFC34_04835 [Methanobacterium sp.]